MNKPLTRSVWFVPFPIKILAAMLSGISISLYVGISRYVKLADRVEDTYYYSLWYTSVISLLINAATILFLIMPFSLFVDGLLAARKKRGLEIRTMDVIVSYFLLGVGCGLVFSIFVYKMGAFQYFGPYLYVLITTFVFLVWQTSLGWILKPRKHGR
ncbi:hypothetical protein [Paenibacillus xylanilyticus]|uniref:hypothetical protein n=1 Tax=Paenibacillus xylanilyticus TaxID=248903 RepID=UPI0039A1FC9E